MDDPTLVFFQTLLVLQLTDASLNVNGAHLAAIVLGMMAFLLSFSVAIGMAPYNAEEIIDRRSI